MQEKARRGIRFRKKDTNSHYLPVILNFSFSPFFGGKAQNTNGKTTNKNLEKVDYKMNIEKSITSILWGKKSISNC